MTARSDTPPYIIAARDLTRWSAPKLVASKNFPLQSEPRGHWSYLYFTLLDPASTNWAFTTVTPTPCVYYVRFDGNNGPYARVLFRRLIKNFDRTVASAGRRASLKIQ